MTPPAGWCAEWGQTVSEAGEDNCKRRGCAGRSMVAAATRSGGWVPEGEEVYVPFRGLSGSRMNSVEP